MQDTILKHLSHSKDNWLANSDKVALANSSGCGFTYEQLSIAVQTIANVLIAHSATQQTPCVLISTKLKIVDAIVAIACIKTGVRFTIIDKQKDNAYLSYVCTHSDSTLAILSSDIKDSESWVSSKISQVHRISVNDAEISIDDITNHIPNREPDVLLTHRNAFPQALFYTSGSTGKPKGIVVSRQLLIDGANCVSQYLGLAESDIILSYLPISFDYGFNQLVCSISCGATLVLEDDFAPLKTGEICSRFKPTVFPGSPSIYLNLGKLIKRKPDCSSFSSIRKLTNTGGRVPEVGHTFINAIVNKYEAKVFLMYGLTESFRSSYLPPELYAKKHNAIGFPVPGVSLFLQDEDGTIISEPNKTGEILHSGHLISYGYYKDADASEKLIASLRHPAFSDMLPPNAVKSGDMGYFDNDGVFFHLGRKDNQVKIREQRTSLEEIEELISKQEFFYANAVIPDYDADGMTIIHIIGIPTPDTPKDVGALRRQLLAVLPKHLAGFKLSMRCELPTNVNGKICRKSLVQEFCKTAEQCYSDA